MREIRKCRMIFSIKLVSIMFIFFNPFPTKVYLSIYIVVLKVYYLKRMSKDDRNRGVKMTHKSVSGVKR